MPSPSTKIQLKAGEQSGKLDRMTDDADGWVKSSLMRTAVVALAGFGLFIGGVSVGRYTNDASERAADPVGAVAGRSSVLQSATIPAGDDQADPEETQAPTEGVTIESLEASLHELDIGAIGFVPGTADLTPEGRLVLADVAAVLVANPFIPIEVEVSAYTKATPGQNHGLSTQMADVIVSALVDDGVASSRLASVGLGSPSRSPDGRDTVLVFDTANAQLLDALGELDTLSIGLDPSGAILSDGVAVLGDVAAELVRHPQAGLELVGYGYAESADASHDLSHSLVDAAAEHLSSLGVDPTRLTTVGLGDAPFSVEVDSLVEFEVGAPAAVTLALREIDGHITFESSSAALTADGLEVVASVADTLALDPTAEVEISVHTYSEADSQQNHDLSHRQGETVVESLVEAGIDPNRLQMVGHGDPPHFAQPGRDTYITFYIIG